MTIEQLAQEFAQLMLVSGFPSKEVLVKIDGEFRRIETSFTDGTFILVAGAPVSQN